MRALLFILLLVLNVQCGHAKSGHQSVGSTSPTSGDEGKQEIPIVESDPSERSSFRFAIISDMNGSYGSKTYGSDVSAAVDYIQAKENGVDFVLSTGDMVAGQKSNLDYAGMWNAFHSTVTRRLLSAGIPIFPSPGNHDAYLTRQTERNHYENSWKKEDPLSKAVDFDFVPGVEQNFPFQYAFKKGEALFIGLDNTAAQQWSSSTLQWLQTVLEQEKQVKLKFIYGHVPLLPFAFKKEREYVAKGLSFLNQVEQLFEKYKVDVFFSGHSHVYYPGRRDLHTEYISVPLLGSGSRYLITQSGGQSLSQRAFIVIDYNDNGEWSLKHYKASSLEIMNDSEFPVDLRMPASNSSLCKYCTQFPKSHFLDSGKRVIYRRRDL